MTVVFRATLKFWVSPQTKHDVFHELLTLIILHVNNAPCSAAFGDD